MKPGTSGEYSRESARQLERMKYSLHVGEQLEALIENGA